ncbi:response regulator transcription factor [Algoriphagus confluentis]|uniref:Two component system response regulator n=1 Tax=Algoriphagus confluentis TaxID=1697556 RepID=A0ABQ6PK72_9BACT|nr:two component system response regulator [Algoriphagus confluentis]
MNLSVAIVDDHELFAGGLKLILDSQPGFHFIRHFRNGKEWIDYLEANLNVDLLVLDLQMPLMDGMQVLPYMRRNHPQIGILVVSGNHTSANMELCKNLGALGFVGKDSNLSVFRDALQAVATGKTYFQEISKDQQKTVRDHGALTKLRDTYLLSPREMEIIQLILHQLETKEIAEKLHLSPLTVKTHRKNIFAKLKVHNVAGLMGLLRET